MKIFISWSGERSRQVAELFSNWIQCVIQAVRPWISTKDIDRGAIWFSEINEQLANISVGVICITQENKDKPWILFESGALAKGLTTNRVCPLLIDLSSVDLTPPLSLFNNTQPTKVGLRELVKTINATLKEGTLHDTVLDNAFETYWPQFEQRFKSIIDSTHSAVVITGRTDSEKMDEVVNTLRMLSQEVVTLKAASTGLKPNSSFIPFSDEKPLRLFCKINIQNYPSKLKTLIFNLEKVYGASDLLIHVNSEKKISELSMQVDSKKHSFEILDFLKAEEGLALIEHEIR